MLFIEYKTIEFILEAIPSRGYGAVTGLCNMQSTQPALRTSEQNPSLYQPSFSSKKQGVMNELHIIVTTDSDDKSITEP